MDMVLESMKLNFQTVLQFGGIQEELHGFTTFAGGVMGGKHTLAVSTNSLGVIDIGTQFNKMMQIEFKK